MLRERKKPVQGHFLIAVPGVSILWVKWRAQLDTEEKYEYVFETDEVLQYVSQA